MMGQKTTPVVEPAQLPGSIFSDKPRYLPYCAYPKASDVDQHGVRPLPTSLPLVDLLRAQPHRSRRYSTVVAADLAPAQLLQMARVVASAFARNEPQARHLRPPKYPPAGFMEAPLRSIRQRHPVRPVERGDAPILVYPPLLVDRPHQPAGLHPGQRGGVSPIPRYRR
jgi:hypothetical protein